MRPIRALAPLVWILTAGAASGCAGGSSSPPPKAATEVEPEEARSSSDATESMSPGEPSAGAEDDVSPTDESANAGNEGTLELEAPEPRDILYKVTPEGLVIEIEGLKLEPSAEPVKVGGGWGVEVSVEVTATDERLYRLLTPENGPLAFAAEIDRKGKKETFTDERQGDDEQFVTPGSSMTLTRRFPDRGVAPLGWGNELTLEAGLWGLGADDERRRPVRKLFVVKMVAGSKPQPIITPPR